MPCAIAPASRTGPGPSGTCSTAPRRLRRAASDGPSSTTRRPSGIARAAPRPTGDDSVAERLMQLDELRRRGIVTDAEFAIKKAELLDRL